MNQIFLDVGFTHFKEACQRIEVKIPDVGFLEISGIIRGKLRGLKANRDFLQLVGSCNPNLSGWPFWLDSSGFDRGFARPVVKNDGWEAILPFRNPETLEGHLDFWRIEPSGRLYHIRALEDDISSNAIKHPPKKVFDLGLLAWRIDEAVRIISRIAGEVDEDFQNSTVLIAVRLSKMSGRKLASWATPHRAPLPPFESVQDSILSIIELPIDLSDTAFPDAVHSIVSPVANMFSGYELRKSVIEDIDKELTRKR